jgi:hypothetical protein
MEVDASADERLGRLLALWHAKRGTRAMPARADFSFEDLLPWLGHLALLDVVAAGDDFRYVVYGTRLAETFGFDLTGRSAREAIPAIGPEPLAEYRRVYASAAPDHVSRVSPANKEHLTITKLALPLSSDGTHIDKIVSVIYRVE